MDNTIMVFSGRKFTSEDINLIKWTRKKYAHLSRSELAGTVCEFLDWTTPTGLHYFVKSGEIKLGCIQFSASSWALESRDKWIGWSIIVSLQLQKF